MDWPTIAGSAGIIAIVGSVFWRFTGARIEKLEELSIAERCHKHGQVETNLENIYNSLKEIRANQATSTAEIKADLALIFQKYDDLIMHLLESGR